MPRRSAASERVNTAHDPSCQGNRDGATWGGLDPHRCGHPSKRRCESIPYDLRCLDRRQSANLGCTGSCSSEESNCRNRHSACLRPSGYELIVRRPQTSQLIPRRIPTRGICPCLAISSRQVFHASHALESRGGSSVILTVYHIVYVLSSLVDSRLQNAGVGSQPDGSNRGEYRSDRTQRIGRLCDPS